MSEPKREAASSPQYRDVTPGGYLRFWNASVSKYYTWNFARHAA